MEPITDSAWSADRLATIAPHWTPNAAIAHTRLQSQLAPRRSTIWPRAALATASLLAAAALIPQGRALAQDLWFRLFLNRIDLVRVDLSKLPLDSHITTNGVESAVDTIEQAERTAGFRPNLPTADVIAGTPVFEVIGAIDVRQEIRTRDLQAALEKAGAWDVHVPEQWNGVNLRVHLGPMISAGYPGEVSILQSQPMEFYVPAGFPLARFAETAFRSLGLSWWESRALGEKFAAHPAWLFDIPTDEPVKLEEVALPAGQGIVVEDFNDKGALDRVTLIYNTPGRLYSISAPSRAICLRIAESLR